MGIAVSGTHVIHFLSLDMCDIQNTKELGITLFKGRRSEEQNPGTTAAFDPW